MKDVFPLQMYPKQMDVIPHHSVVLCFGMGIDTSLNKKNR